MRNVNRSLLGLIITAVLASCGAKDVKFQQYYIQGEQLYLKNCSNCHQKSGKGLGLVFPPLDQSDYIDKNFEEVICLIKYGKAGEMIVNGNLFNKSMPGIPTLTDLEVAEIATYIGNTWGRQRGLVNVNDATKLLNACDQ